MFLECNKNDRIETQGLHTKDRCFNILAPEVLTVPINKEEKIVYSPAAETAGE
jgi:hypothetical protein